MPRSLPTLAILSALLAATSGCRCGGTQTDRVYAEVELVYPGDDGAELVSRDSAVYDFGPVFMGERVEGKVVIHNAGNAQLLLKSAAAVSGDPLGFNADLATTDVFNLQLRAGTAVDPGGRVELPLSFLPPQNPDRTVESEQHEAVVSVETEGTRGGQGTATFTVRGRGVSGVCDVDRVLDFGAVQKGTTSRRAIRLRNPARIPATVTLGDPYSSTGDHTAYAFSEGMPHGTVTLPPQTESELFIDFAPSSVKPYVAFLKVRASAQCPEVVVSLEGQGVDQVLSWNPMLVDCSFSPLGFEVTRDLTFTNLGRDPVSVAAFTPSSPEYRIVPGSSFDGQTLVVPGKGDATVKVGCTPSKLGERTGSIDFSTNLPGQSSGRIGVRVLGGGPDIDVKPAAAVAFGPVAYFPNSNAYQTRRVTVLNVGTRPSATDDSANLKLGKLNNLGDRVAPWAELVPDPATTQPNEFQITISQSYDPTRGVAAVLGQNFTDFTVKFTPKSLGPKSATLTIFSNDPDEPTVTLNVTAEAITMAPCTYGLSPGNLNFGLVNPPNWRDLPLTISNLGQTDCVVSGLDFAADTNLAYTLPNGAIASQTLPAGQSLVVNVRSWPQIPPTAQVATLLGNLVFFVNSPNPPSAVPLSTTLASSCLTIAPDEVDFGTVRLGCSSNERTFTVYNVCQTSLTLNQVRVQAGAGLPPNTPPCSGNAACPEFSIVQKPSLPLAMNPGGAPVSFSAKYRPIDLGADQGALALDVLQGGQPITYLVTTVGRGDANGENTDLFAQDANPKADILLTIDNSCSMSSYQSSLATNFASFMTYANAQGIDFHIAVTTTDDTVAAGKMVYAPSTNPDKVLTPQTPNVSSQFQAKVNVGVNGSGTETGLSPSLKALTTPLIATDNAGFLRPDANLGIVVVTDAPDQSAGTSAYYISALNNIKGARHANQFSFSAVAGFAPNPPSSCPYDTGPDDGKYADVVSATRGVKEEICTQNWAQTLQRLGKTLFGYRTSFFLTALPDLSGSNTLDVKLDGTPLPAVDGTGATAWSYDSATNSITFQPGYIPEPGQTVSVHYFVSCYP